MKQHIVGFFRKFADAGRAVQELEEMGLKMSQISVITRERESINSMMNESSDGELSDNDPIGASKGAVLGGITGLIVGIGALVIPGLGPVIAAGPLAAALGVGVGAATGAVVAPIADSLMGAGIPKNDAEGFAEGIRRGGTLVSVAATEEQSEMVEDILERNGASDIDDHRHHWAREDVVAREDVADRDESVAGVGGSMYSFSGEDVDGIASTTDRPHLEPFDDFKDEDDYSTKYFSIGAVRIYTEMEDFPEKEESQIANDAALSSRESIGSTTRPTSGIEMSSSRQDGESFENNPDLSTSGLHETAEKPPLPIRGGRL